MTSFGYVIITFAKILHFVINLYTFIIAAAVIMSWVKVGGNSPIVKIVRQLTDPVLNRVRRIMPKAMFRTGLDLTPMVVLLVLILIDSIVVELLMELGRSLLLQ